MTSDGEYTPQQMEEVWSWVHNQDRCVTTQTVSLDLCLPRSVACKLLEELPHHKVDSEERLTYELTKCCLVEEAPNKSVVKLVKSTVTVPSAQGESSSQEGVIYSISLKGTESVETAHERDMTNVREQLDGQSSPHVLDPSLHCYNVSPLEPVQRTNQEAIRQERVAGASSNPTKPVSKATVMRKTTTPSDFFSKTKESGEAKKAENKTAKSKSASTKKASAPTKKESQARKESQANKKKKTVFILSDPENDTDDTVDFSQPSPPKKMRGEEEKENAVNNNKGVGNADDFVGDLDEDDEFLAADEERKKRNAKQQAIQEKQQALANAERTKQQQKLQAARQARHQPEETTPTTEPAKTERKRKRRKKLVDKTSMDANGYLHTETVTVWEDIPTDEEEEEAKKSAAAMKPVHKKPVKKNMKQAGLMGFFKKK